MKTLLFILALTWNFNTVSFCDEEGDSNVGVSQEETTVASEEPRPASKLGPNGGLLTSLGENKPWLETVLEPESGYLVVFFLTPSQDDYLYLDVNEFKIQVSAIEDRKNSELSLPAEITLKAAKDPWNEGKFDASQFMIESADLQGSQGVNFTIPKLNVQGTEVSNLSINLNLKELHAGME